MVLAPEARLLPFTASVALPFAPEAVSGDVPSTVVPAANVTLPVGAAVPLAGLTVAVNCVVAVDEMLAGFANTAVVVATGGGVTVTLTVAVEPVKLPVGV